MPWRLHRDRAFRGWLGARAGGDAELGDRLLRRAFHLGAAGVLVYYIVPARMFVVVTTSQLLLLGLAGVLALEGLRLLHAVEIPTLRDYEAGRPASYAYYGVALVAAILLFPEPIAITVVLGTAAIDPLIGELRLAGPSVRRWYPGGPVVAYSALALVGLVLVGAWSPERAIAGGVLAAVVAVAAERPKIVGVDDDLAMTLAPAAALLAFGLLGPGAPVHLAGV
ncbi:MAG: hypothetical protein L3K17_04220 [Thermoplasmata archaeon]|nr:hypothetical protein [Thermoplasmata archaeon]